MTQTISDQLLWQKYQQAAQKVADDASGKNNLIKVAMEAAKRLLSQTIFQAQVTSVSGNTVTITRLGQSAADNTSYQASSGLAVQLVSGDPVVVVKIGASYVVVAKIQNANASLVHVGSVALPALGANSQGTVTVTNANTGSNGWVALTAMNTNADATSGRGVVVWVDAFTPGASFVIGYRTVAAMAHAWSCFYELVG